MANLSKFHIVFSSSTQAYTPQQGHIRRALSNLMFVTVLCCRLLRYVLTMVVFHDCLNFGVVYGVGVCVNVCVIVCCLFLMSGC